MIMKLKDSIPQSLGLYYNIYIMYTELTFCVCVRDLEIWRLDATSCSSAYSFLGQMVSQIDARSGFSLG